ncbi:MAG TPA: tRNA lysidine(34) synthetase TilS [Vicinamibacterales bacterium]|nr:tRNA lysidine(34) synthetase TilS [Vicinamibacterales bacterium]
MATLPQLRLDLIGVSDRVAVAVSGGSDSVALLRLLVDAARDRSWSVAGVVHVNHGLRAAAAEDEAFVRELAASLALPIEVCRVDVTTAARAARRSVEATARDLRYGCFEDARRRLGATLVATGHTLDDQAETVLLRLLRGAGSRGLGGVRVRRGAVVRPLLECRRADLRVWLEAIGQPFVEDGSNADVAIARNRIRHEVLPVLERHAPGAVRALARCAALAADDETFLSELAIQLAASTVLVNRQPGEPLTLEATALGGAPAPLARRIVRDAAEQVSDGRAAWSAEHVEAVLRLARADKPRGHLDLPGISVERAADAVLFRAAKRLDVADEAAGTDGFEVALPVPGRAEIPGDRGAIVARRVSGDEAAAPMPQANDARACLNAAAVTPPLTVRSRRPGDRFRPLGAPGSRKLQDVFVDRRVPRSERDRVPVVSDATGRILWVAGVAVAEECRVTRPEAGMVILELKSR